MKGFVKSTSMEDEVTREQLVTKLENLHRSNKLLTELTECAIELMDRPPSDLDEGLKTLVLLANRLLDTHHGFICRVSDQSEFKAGCGFFSQDSNDIKLLVQYILENDHSLLIKDCNSWRELSSHGLLQSILVVPIRHFDHVIGVIGVAQDKEASHVFNDYELEILEKFANVASKAMNQTAQLGNMQQRFAKEIIFTSILEKIFVSSVLNLDVLKMLETLCQELVQVLEADKCKIALLDPTTINLTVVTQDPATTIEGGNITGETMLVANTQLFKETIEKKFIPDRQEKTPYLVVNLLSVDETVTGITILEKADQNKPFNFDEIRFAVNIIEHISQKVAKGQYYKVIEQIKMNS